MAMRRLPAYSACRARGFMLGTAEGATSAAGRLAIQLLAPARRRVPGLHLSTEAIDRHGSCPRDLRTPPGKEAAAERRREARLRIWFSLCCPAEQARRVAEAPPRAHRH